ncbi:MAG: stage III sporulation protein D [Ruminococcaceae bacterium]|nr:stage III sporulation protein D [Oscillospiraceae bacterium]
MRHEVKSRPVMLGEYILETGATVRATAKVFNVSKSTVHTDVATRLRYEDPALYKRVRKILDINKEERHIRGGIATKNKYKKDLPTR